MRVRENGAYGLAIGIRQCYFSFAIAIFDGGAFYFVKIALVFILPFFIIMVFFTMGRRGGVYVLLGEA